jgi:hypothetical protein
MSNEPSTWDMERGKGGGDGSGNKVDGKQPGKNFLIGVYQTVIQSRN